MAPSMTSPIVRSSLPKLPASGPYQLLNARVPIGMLEKVRGPVSQKERGDHEGLVRVNLAIDARGSIVSIIEGRDCDIEAARNLSLIHI